MTSHGVTTCDVLSVEFARLKRVALGTGPSVAFPSRTVFASSVAFPMGLVSKTVSLVATLVFNSVSGRSSTGKKTRSCHSKWLMGAAGTAQSTSVPLPACTCVPSSRWAPTQSDALGSAKAGSTTAVQVAARESSNGMYSTSCSGSAPMDTLPTQGWPSSMVKPSDSTSVHSLAGLQARTAAR